MTKKEALKAIKKMDTEILINKIFDNIESQICENCKYFDKLPYGLKTHWLYEDKKNIGICKYIEEDDDEYTDFNKSKIGIHLCSWDAFMGVVYVRVNKDFGCKHFKSKEDK